MTKDSTSDPIDQPVADAHEARAIGGGGGVVRDHDDGALAAASGSFESSVRISRLVVVSRLPVGSSQSTASGSATSARATATRCISPPEISSGKWSAAVGEVDTFEALARRASSAAAPRAAEQERQGDVLGGGERGQQVERLEDEADAVAAEERALPVGHAICRSCPWKTAPRRRSGVSSAP